MTISKEDARMKFGLTTPEACAQLKADTSGIAILRLMKNLGYFESNFFKGLWNIPPSGITHREWQDRHGVVPTYSLRKGTNSEIATRVANYLGFFLELDDEKEDVVPTTLEGKKRQFKKTLEDTSAEDELALLTDTVLDQASADAKKALLEKLLADEKAGNWGK